jgi:hypothetical protein
MLAKAYLLQITPPKNPQRTLMFSLDSKNQIRNLEANMEPIHCKSAVCAKNMDRPKPNHHSHVPCKYDQC